MGSTYLNTFLSKHLYFIYLSVPVGLCDNELDWQLDWLEIYLGG